MPRAPKKTHGKVKKGRSPKAPYRSPYARTGGFVGMENKYLDCGFVTGLLDTSWGVCNPSSGSTGCISAPAVGDGPTENDGRTYKITSVHLKGEATVGAATASAVPPGATHVRIVLVLDTQTNGATLDAADVMLNAAPAPLHGFRNLEYTRRFVVLKDKTLKLNPQVTGNGVANQFANGTEQAHFRMNKKFKNPIVVRRTSGTTANVANIADNSLHVIACYDGNLQGGLSFTSRVRFVG